MDALDSMFVPYRDLLTPPASSSKSDRSKWIWIGLLILVAGIGVFVFSRSSVKSHSPSQPFPLPSPPKQPVQPLTLPLPVPKHTAPLFQAVPQKIDLIRGGDKEKRAKAESPQDLAKQVALAVKETLLTFPDMTAPLLASIVECSVKNILKPQEAQTQQKPVTQTQMQASIQPQMPPKRTGGFVKLQSLDDVPIVEEEEISASGGSKQGKINADSDPNVLRRLRERGLDKNSRA